MGSIGSGNDDHLDGDTIIDDDKDSSNDLILPLVSSCSLIKNKSLSSLVVAAGVVAVLYHLCWEQKLHYYYHHYDQ